MQFTQRDKWLLVLFPTLVFSVVFFVGWFRPRLNDFNSALKNRDAAEVGLPALQKKVLLARLQQAQAARELQTAQRDRATAQKAWDEAAGRCTDILCRNDRIEKLNSLLARRGLHLVEDSLADSSRDSKVSPGVDGLGKQFEVLSGKPKPQVRKIRLVGRYLDVLGALEDLAANDLLAIPLCLSMHEAPLRSTQREWVLLVWI